MKLSFATNVPVEIAGLESLDGEAAESQFGGEQTKFITSNRDIFFVSVLVGKIISDGCRKLKIDAGDPVVICKAEVPDGRGRKQVRWLVTRVGSPVGQQADGTFAAPKTNGANGSRPPAPLPASSPASASTPNDSSSVPLDCVGGPGGKASLAPANGHAALPAERPRTKMEDALCTVAAALLTAERYAKSIGYEAWPKQFTGDEVVRLANTMLINGARENGNGGAR